MAWAPVPGSAGIFEYENTATAADTYSDANGTYSGGIRSYTPPGGSLQEIYARTRMTVDATGRVHIEEITFTSASETGTNIEIGFPQGAAVIVTAVIGDSPTVIAQKFVAAFIGNPHWVATNVGPILTLTAIAPEFLYSSVTVDAGTTGITSTQKTTQNGLRITSQERGELSKNYYDARI